VPARREERKEVQVAISSAVVGDLGDRLCDIRDERVMCDEDEVEEDAEVNVVDVDDDDVDVDGAAGPGSGSSGPSNSFG